MFIEMPLVISQVAYFTETGRMSVGPSLPLGNRENSVADVVELKFFPFSLVLR
jgi:hypothetical protein